MAITVNKGELARLFDVSEPTVAKWVREGCPTVSAGSNGVAYEFDPAAVKSWRDGIVAAEDADRASRLQQIETLQASLFGPDQLPKIEGAGNLTPEARKKFYDAELTRMRLMRDRGDLVQAIDLRITLGQALAELRNRIRGVPDQLARMSGLTEAQVQSAETLIDDALEDVVTKLQSHLSASSVPARAAA